MLSYRFHFPKARHELHKPIHFFPLLNFALPLSFALCLAAVPCSADPRDFSFRFNLWNEATATGVNRSSPFNPDNLWLDLPVWSNSFVAEGEASYRFGQRVKIAGGFNNRFDYVSEGHDRLRLKELYLSWSMDSHWDLTVGRRILKWGTGYAWTPTGVLDPRHDPRDPTDRLNQYEGTDLVEVRGTFGRHNCTAVYAAPNLFSKQQAGGRGDQWAFKYNSLVKKLDYSLIASIGGPGTANRYGANATYVAGQALELHAEYVAQRGSRLPYPLAIELSNPRVTFTSPPYAPLKEHDNGIYSRALVGANYTFPSGWNLVVEYYRDGQGLSELEHARFDTYVGYNEEQHRLLAGTDPSQITLPAANLLWTLQGVGGFSRARDYFFARVARDRMAQKWNLENIAIFSLRDGSSIWIPQISYDFSERFGTYLRYTHYAGGRMTEFGSLPWRWTCNLGLALRF